jgi:hypothetical protein
MFEINEIKRFLKMDVGGVLLISFGNDTSKNPIVSGVRSTFSGWIWYR